MCVMASHKYVFAYIKNVTKSEGKRIKKGKHDLEEWNTKLYVYLGQGERRQENEGTNDEDAYEGTL